MIILIFLLFFVCQCFALEEQCPDTDISPCTCKTYFDGACIITCSLSSQESVEKIGDIPNLCNGHVHFVLVHSKISGIPAKLWKTLLSSKTVDVSIKHSGIEGLIPPEGENIPEVHTPGTAVIKIDHTKVGQWDWKQFHKFSSEELTLVIDDTPLSEISSDFTQIAGGQLHKITIDSTGLQELPDKIFANFKDLNSLSLQNNKLTFISRSAIPKPANKLEFLHLNGNLLTTLPGDLFSEMPSLEVVYLRDNRLASIPEELFKSISSNKLQRIDLVHNPWECNCQLIWILTRAKQHMNLGTCSSPDSLAGKGVKDALKLLDC